VSVAAQRPKSDLPAKIATGAGWRGDDHQLEVEAAAEAGLVKSEAELESFTRGFSEGIAMEDPADGAIVARGRTVLTAKELAKNLVHTLRYLGVPRDAVVTRVHDGAFELRIAKHAAESGNPVLVAGKFALQVWIGFGLLGLASYQLIAPFVAAIIWGLGLVLGGWQLRRGLATGRAMLAARLALALAMVAQEEKLILPPAEGS
jgi:hypothetical protein